MPAFIWIGLTPATTALRPSLKIASANTVAVVVPSPATSLVLLATSRTMRAPMFFVDVFDVDFFGDGDAVFGDGGRAKALLQDHVRTLGPQRDLDGPGELSNAATNGVASFLIKGDDFRALRVYLLCRV